MAVTGMHIGGEIAKALGLPAETTDILIAIGLDEPIAVICRYFPTAEAMQALKAIVSRYHLEIAEGASTPDAFIPEQRQRLFRQSLLRGEMGVESPYLQRYLARKQEATALDVLLGKMPTDLDVSVIHRRLAELRELLSRMEAGEAV